MGRSRNRIGDNMALIGSVNNWGTLQGQINSANGYLTGVISSAALMGGQVVGMRGLPGEKGDTGDTGNGIASVSKTGTVGLVDTYTITYTNGTTSTFTVTNGKDGTDGVDGRDGADGHSPVITTSRAGKTVTILSDGESIGTVEDGADGSDGQDGQDGFSPIANVSKVGDTSTITITDENGTTTATVKDGTDGTDGQDGHSPVVTASKVGDTTTVYVDGTPIAEIEDGQDAGVIDLGNIDPSEYEDDREVFLNTLLQDGAYRFVWEDGDDYEYYVVVESMLDYGFVYQKYWYSEEGSNILYHCSLRVEDGEVVERSEENYMTLTDASIMFAIKNHGHYENKNAAMTVLDWCDSNALTFDNTKPFILYTDTLNSKNWIIERYATVRSPNYRFIRVYDMSDASHFYIRSGSLVGNTTVWGSWKEYSSGGGGGGVSDVTIDGTSIVTGGVAELETVTQLRDGIMTATDKQKLDGIESGAEVNVQSDWNANSGDAQILNKPSIPANTSDLVNNSGFITSPNVVYCTCDTAAGTAAKTATIVSGTLTSLNAGDQAIVKFVNTNTASNPTLNIAGTGAKAIKRYGTTAVGTTNATSWTAGTTFICVYDGTNWALVSWINTAYSEISEANITSGSSSSTGLVSGRRVKKAVETFAPVTSVNGQTGAVTIDSDVFYAEYNVTSFQDVKDAYDDGKTIIAFDVNNGTTLYYPLSAYADTGGTEGFAFEKIDADCYYTRLILLDTDVWSKIDGYLPYNNLDGTPTNLSDFNNDSGFIAEDSNGDVDISGAYKTNGKYIGSYIKVCGASNTTTLSTSPKKIEMHTKLEGKGNAFSLDGGVGGSFGINCEYGGTLQVSGKVRVGSNYTAQDIVLISIYVNSTEVYMHRYRVPPNMTTPAQDITLPTIPLTVSASDKITLEVVNGTGARGTIIDDECKLYAMYIAPTLS